MNTQGTLWNIQELRFEYKGKKQIKIFFTLILDENLRDIFILNLYTALPEFFKMVLIKAIALVVQEILPSEVFKQNFRFPITAEISKITKSPDCRVTFIFDVVSESGIFVQTLLVLLQNKGTFLKEMPLNRERGGIIMQIYLETFYFFKSYNVRHKVFTKILPF